MTVAEAISTLNMSLPNWHKFQELKVRDGSIVNTEVPVNDLGNTSLLMRLRDCSIFEGLKRRTSCNDHKYDSENSPYTKIPR